MVAQVIGLIVITAMISLVAAMAKKLGSETSVAEAQVRLRQISHLLLRDTQGISGDTSVLGDLVLVTDGGAASPDQLGLFKRDESVCGGSVALGTGPFTTSAAVTNVDTDLTATVNNQCPIGLTVCPAAEIAARTTLLIGTRAVELSGVTASPCTLTFPTGAQATQAISIYNLRYGTSFSTLPDVLADANPKTAAFGTAFRYRLSGTNLQRSTDGAVTFETVVENVQDFQVERVYYDDDATPNQQLSFTGSTGAALPAGFDESEFVGLRLGVMTFSPAKGDLETRPPAVFSNRTQSAPTGRRYRSSFVFAASRNRTGA